MPSVFTDGGCPQTQFFRQELIVGPIEFCSGIKRVCLVRVNVTYSFAP
jgi:hypothetical protein